MKQLLLLLLLLPVSVSAQTSIHFNVTNALTGSPVPEAKMKLTFATDLGDTTFYLQTSTGKFIVRESLPHGRGSIEITHPNYLPFSLPQYLFTEGGEANLEIQLQPAPTQLAEVAVAAPAAYMPFALSSRSFTVEETQRFAATYNDPARVALAMPGVVNANDQANNLIIRGLAPHLMGWRVEGCRCAEPQPPK